MANGDNYGKKTEALMKKILESTGDYKHYDGSYHTINGFDGVFVKGDLSNPTEIIINESKQWTGSGISLSGATTTNPAQMTDAWVDKVAGELIKAAEAQSPVDTTKKLLGEKIRMLKGTSRLTKVVTAVDRTPKGSTDDLLGRIAVIRVN